MTLNEAIEKMRAGCIVRRSAKPEFSFTMESSRAGELIIRHVRGRRQEVGSVYYADVLATDWEVLPKGEA